MMKATLFVRKDHDRLRELFAQYRNAKLTTQNGKRGVFDEIRRELSIHSVIELELFYPELRNSVSDRAEDLMRSAIEEHHRIEQILTEAQESSGNEKLFDSKVIELIEAVEAHIDREEEEIFYELRRSLSERRLEELGLELENRKFILTRVAA